MGSLSKNALGMLLHCHIKESIVIWTRLSREKTNLSKHHSLCSWLGGGVPWSWRVTWVHWALGEFYASGGPLWYDVLGINKCIYPLSCEQLSVLH